jgi:hypothetical protein
MSNIANSLNSRINLPTMDRIYNRAEDKNSAIIIVYSKNNTPYADKDCTRQLTQDELIAVFMKGCMVVIGDTFYRPVSVSNNPTQGGVPRHVDLSYIKVDSSGTVTSGKLSTTL